jgi:hypothetical protein
MKTDILIILILVIFLFKKKCKNENFSNNEYETFKLNNSDSILNLQSCLLDVGDDCPSDDYYNSLKISLSEKLNNNDTENEMLQKSDGLLRDSFENDKNKFQNLVNNNF